MHGELARLPGVARVLVDEARAEVCLLLRAGTPAAAVAEAARALAPADYTVSTAVDTDAPGRERLRLVGVQREPARDGQVGFEVTLEWDGVRYPGSATGDTGDAAELRTIARATLAAVARVVPEDIALRLAGIKQLRAFDAELIVASLLGPSGAARNMVGAVVAGSDPQRAAAAAVLSALNRVLGNFLAR